MIRTSGGIQGQRILLRFFLVAMMDRNIGDRGTVCAGIDHLSDMEFTISSRVMESARDDPESYP
jgi:hypothetical protein